ncbi:MAG: rRNA maturation RNase YbeY [Armatimonadetes bacterium]|nr:rRNA maturation RNase YbeY [Armatimonadota bacterium]
MKIQPRNLQPVPVDRDKLKHVLEGAAEQLGTTVDSLSVALVDDARISRLNRQLLQHSGPTDVIAFEAEQDAEGSSGEIIISVQTAQRQAQQYGHSLMAELCLLAIHGLLHVMGYEDQTEAGRAEMERIQESLMDEVGP